MFLAETIVWALKLGNGLPELSTPSPTHAGTHRPTQESEMVRRAYTGRERERMNSPQLPLGRTRVLFPSESERSPADRHPVGSGGLESSLLGLIHHHHHQSIVLRDRAEKAKRDAIGSAAAVSDLLVEAVNGGVQEAFTNQKRIELEIRALAATVSHFMKQTDHWLASTHAINSVIKEIGDFESWMKIMDFDCKSINAAIRNIHQA